MKACRNCQVEKSADGFYATVRQPCKECVKVRARKYRAENLERVQEYDRERGSLPARRLDRKLRAKSLPPEKKAEYARRYWDKHAAKRHAHTVTGNAIRAGLLKAKPCERCGFALGVQAHHEDYGKPLDVVWLCTKCHGERHREINAERRRKAA